MGYGSVSRTDLEGYDFQELTLALNMDSLSSSYGRVVGIAALYGIYHMQKTGKPSFISSSF